MVEDLTSMCEVLSSIPNTANKKKFLAPGRAKTEDSKMAAYLELLR